jgi:hypothetical protein
MAYSYDRRTAAGPISMKDLKAVFERLRALAERNKKHEGVYQETPAEPDTSKFIAPQYGDIAAVLNGSPRSYLLLGLTVGSTWGMPADTSSLSPDARHKAYVEKDKLQKKVFAEARKLMEPVAKKYGLTIREQSGTAYSQIGIEGSRDMNLVP